MNLQERLKTGISRKVSSFSTKFNIEDAQDTKLVTKLNEKLHSRDTSAQQTIVQGFEQEQRSGKFGEKIYREPE